MSRSRSRPARTALLVGDPDSRTALSGARALARAGWQVHLAGGAGRGLAGWSRCVHARHALPAPDSDPEGFVSALARLAEALPAAVLLACGDAELLAAARAADRFPETLRVPPLPVVEALVDKSRLAGRARAAGLRVPEEVGRAPLQWPVVVKAAVHHAPGRRSHRWEAVVALDRPALEAALARADAAGVEVLVQEHVAGRLEALSVVLSADGLVVGRCQQVAERIWPVAAGVSARARTVVVDEQRAARCADLLRGVGWTGLAQLQFLARAGQPPCLIDVNPRLYGSVRLAVAAGAPLPDLAGRVLVGERVPVHPDARPGVRYQWLLGDVLAGATTSGLARSAAASARSAYGAAGAVRDRSDPLPVVVAAAGLAARAARSLLRAPDSSDHAV